MSALTTLDALLRAMPAICHALDQIDPRWQDKAFDRLCDAAVTDAVQPPSSGGYSGNLTGYDPASTSLMPSVRDGYDPLSAR